MLDRYHCKCPGLSADFGNNQLLTHYEIFVQYLQITILPSQAYKRIPASRAELSTEFFLVPELFDRNSTGGSVATVISVPAPNRNVTLLNRSSSLGGGGVGIFTQQNHHQQSDSVSLLRERPWALPLISLSIVAMLLMAGFEVFVLLKVTIWPPTL